MAEPNRPCVFCGNFRKPTKEHIWGKWIRRFIPPDPPAHYLRDVEFYKMGTPDRERVSVTQRPGSALGSFRHILCARCNNGPLSRVQNEAKKHLIPLLKGQKSAIGIVGQEAIAAWATMVTMTAEFLLDSGSKIGISQDARQTLVSTEAALSDWRIWIAYYDGGTWSHRWSHTSIPIVGGEKLPSAELVYTPLPNTQTTTYIVGKLYVHTMSCDYPDVASNWNWLGNNRLRTLLVPIWPIRHQFIGWPWHGVNDADIRLSSEMFIRWADDIACASGF